MSVIGPAIEGLPFQGDSSNAETFAAWIYLKALLAEAAFRERDGEVRASWPTGLIPEFHNFYSQRKPGIGARVWLGRYDLSDAWPELAGRVAVGQVTYRHASVEYRGCQVQFTMGNLLGITVRWNAQAN